MITEDVGHAYYVMNGEGFRVISHSISFRSKDETEEKITLQSMGPDRTQIICNRNWLETHTDKVPFEELKL